MDSKACGVPDSKPSWGLAPHGLPGTWCRRNGGVTAVWGGLMGGGGGGAQPVVANSWPQGLNCLARGFEWFVQSFEWLAVVISYAHT